MTGQPRYPVPHRYPGEETLGLYPGLVVSDGEHSRQGGSITAGRSRLPLWAFLPGCVSAGWSASEDYYGDGYEETFGRRAAADFIANLLDLRGEFGRLLLVLADAERCDSHGTGLPWVERKRHRKRVGEQLRRCLAMLEESAKCEVAG